MIRFCNKEDISQKDVELALTREPLLLDRDIWRKGRENFKYVSHNSDSLFLIPVINKAGSIICFAYQDNEANRELRFLEEIQEMGGALQFTDIFPDKDSVTIHGCNELAFYFLQYMTKIGVTAYVVGKYWDALGYQQIYKEPDAHNLVIFAEGTNQEWLGEYSVNKAICSMSAEFECVDWIYEENVRKGIIKDTEFSFEELIEQLRTKDEIVIMGIGGQSQDAYDLLQDKGIDIYCFMQDGITCSRRLFGKPIFSRNEIFRNLKNPVFIRCLDSNSALGTEAVEDYNYYGYRRNKSFFVLNDYTNIPESGLLHVLENRKIVLAGDKQLCDILRNYYQRELGDKIRVRYTDNIVNEILEDEMGILAFHKPYGPNQLTDRQSEVENAIGKKGGNYTEYFQTIEHFAYIEQESPKYRLSVIKPKGILLGCIPGLNGNIFFRGILDGHPQILKIENTYLSNNLFSFCIRLSHEKAENIFEIFWQIYNLEADLECIEQEFPNKEKFDRKLKELLALADHFTSQELFVVFTIAYEAMYDTEMEPLSDKVIYWEAHGCGRDVFSYYAKWLEDKEVTGNTIRIARNEIVRLGSIVNNYDHFHNYLDDTDFWKLTDVTSLYNARSYKGDYWKEFTVRFEDLKLIPKQAINKICEKIGVAWNESLLQTTSRGKNSYYESTTGFSLRPVYDSYENYLSVLDRFRISVSFAYTQKQYGYPYMETNVFSRRELQAVYLKAFRFEKQIEFKNYKKEIFYKRQIYHSLSLLLWKARKSFLLEFLNGAGELGEYDDICKVHRYRDISLDGSSTVTKQL